MEWFGDVDVTISVSPSRFDVAEVLDNLFRLPNPGPNPQSDSRRGRRRQAEELNAGRERSIPNHHLECCEQLPEDVHVLLGAPQRLGQVFVLALFILHTDCNPCWYMLELDGAAALVYVLSSRPARPADMVYYIIGGYLDIKLFRFRQ